MAYRWMARACLTCTSNEMMNLLNDNDIQAHNNKNYKSIWPATVWQIRINMCLYREVYGIYVSLFTTAMKCSSGKNGYLYWAKSNIYSGDNNNNDNYWKCIFALIFTMPIYNSVLCITRAIIAIAMLCIVYNFHGNALVCRIVFFVVLRIYSDRPLVNIILLYSS